MNQKSTNRNSLLVVAICGSLRSESYTRKALHLALEGARELGAQTRLLDLRDYELTFCRGKEQESSCPEGVFQLRRDVSEAQGIILGTPEYHGSFSGVLKNALDLMGFSEFEGKMIGLIGVSGGKGGALHALNGLRIVGRALHAWVIPEEASLPSVWQQFDENGRVKNPDLVKRVKQVGRQVARFAYLHSADEAREFLRVWEQAVENPGGDWSE